MTSLTTSFEDRLQEIDAYLELLGVLDREVQSGRPPTIGDTPISVRQQRILYSAVYLQLYNLVEATVTWCVDAICEAAAIGGQWNPSDLSTQMRREWVRQTARTHTVLNEERRLFYALETCEAVVRSDPVQWPNEMPRKSNWDDFDIEALSERLGCDLALSAPTLRGVREPIRDDKGPLKLVKDLRNRLAHGSISFEECGSNVTIDDLTITKNRTVAYLREVVTAYSAHIDHYCFLEEAKRPPRGAEA